MNKITSTFASLGLAALSLTPSLHAQAQEVAFPMDPLGTAIVPGVLEYQPVSAKLADLANYEDITFTRWPVPGGGSVELQLQRVHPKWHNLQIYADGAPYDWNPGDLTLWRGQVAGESARSAWVSFSSYGCYGHFRVGGELYNISSFAATPDEWSSASVRFYSETQNQASAVLRSGECEAERLWTQGGSKPQSSSSSSGPQPLGFSPTLECKVAIETDYPFYQNWFNLTAATNYLMTLLAEISDQYNTDLDVVLTYPYVQLYTSNNDPWTDYSSMGALLNQFENNFFPLPNGAHLGHLVSGSNLGGGLASLDVLCTPQWGMGLSAEIDGGTQFPVNQGSDTWDFVVISHELGHQFGSPHTHNYNPPIDTCGSGGPCTTGTIMSYCHLCSFAGLSNIQTEFHPTVANNMRVDAVNSCLPVFVPPCVEDGFEDNDNCGQPALIGTGTLADLQSVQGDPDWFELSVPNGNTIQVDVVFLDADGDVDVRLYDDFCLGLLDSGISTSNNETVTWTNNTGSTKDVHIEVFLGDSSDCNTYDLVTSFVFDPCTSAVDDAFEPNDSCGAPAAMDSGFDSNLFVRKSDPDFYTYCVAAGSTVNVDLLFQHASGDIDMYLFTEANCPLGGIGALTSSTSSTDNESISWLNNTGAAVQVVLEVQVWASSASDCLNYSMITNVVTGDCSGAPVAGPIGSLYCNPANNNSTGDFAKISAFGFTDVTENDVTLTTIDLPANQFGFYLVSANQGLVMSPGGSAGNLCLTGDIGRYQGNVQSSGASGSFSLAIDLTSIPVNPPEMTFVGTTWNFTTWYRDTFLGVPISNFSTAIEINFD